MPPVKVADPPNNGRQETSVCGQSPRSRVGHLRAFLPRRLSVFGMALPWSVLPNKVAIAPA